MIIKSSTSQVRDRKGTRFFQGSAAKSFNDSISLETDYNKFSMDTSKNINILVDSVLVRLCELPSVSSEISALFTPFYCYIL